MCASAKNCEKFTKTPFWEFKVVYGLANESKKLVASACCDKQHVCTYLQSFSRYTSQ